MAGVAAVLQARRPNATRLSPSTWKHPDPGGSGEKSGEDQRAWRDTPQPHRREQPTQQERSPKRWARTTQTAARPWSGVVFWPGLSPPAPYGRSCLPTVNPGTQLNQDRSERPMNIDDASDSHIQAVNRCGYARQQEPNRNGPPVEFLRTAVLFSRVTRAKLQGWSQRRPLFRDPATSGPRNPSACRSWPES